MKKLFLLATLLSFTTKLTYCQSGRSDLSFGANGIVKTDMGVHFDNPLQGTQVITRSDGSLYILLNPSATIIRRLADGSPDVNYGIGGFSSSSPFSTSLAAFQPDGKIVIAGDGANGPGITRVNVNGITDSSFGVDGFQVTAFSARSVVIQNDAKIVVTGGIDNNGFVVARYKKDGGIDETFNGSGVVATSFDYKVPPDRGEEDSEIVQSGYSNILAIQHDGKIIAAGEAYTTADNVNTSFAIARYNTDGSLDSTFGENGKQTTRVNNGEDDIVNSLGIQSDGKIIAGGNHFDLFRYTSNGAPDSSFNGSGKKIVNTGLNGQTSNSLTIQADDKIVAAGYAVNGVYSDFVVTRINNNGSLDSAFDEDGIQVTNIASSSDDYGNSVAIQNDDKIIVAGYSVFYSEANAPAHLAVSRYNADGSPDISFNKGGKLIGSSDQGSTTFNDVAVQPDGRVVAAGLTWNGSNYDFAIIRYNSNGSPDSSFNNNGQQITDLGSDEQQPHIIIQKNDKIILAGTAGQVNSSAVSLMRYNNDGTPDSTFGTGGKVISDLGYLFANATAVAAQNDDKIIVAVNTVDDGFNSGFIIARYNPDGTIDSTFGNNGVKTFSQDQFAFFGLSLTVQKDDKILIAGFTTADLAVLRLNTDGSLDNTFSDDGIQTTDFGLSDEAATSVVVQNDGKIMVGGSSRGSANVSLLSRYTANGNADSTFNGTGTEITHSGNVVSIVLQNDGKILEAVGSQFLISRFNVNGSIDNTFGNNGIQVTNVGTTGSSSIGGIALSADRLYAVGYGEYPGKLGVVASYLLNSAPTVTLITPADSATYLSGANVYFNAFASDADGTVIKVEFYSDTTLLFTATDTPYTFKWGHVKRGNYTLIAKATDNSGFTAIDSVHISVVPNKPPTVSLTNPANGQTFLKGATIHLQAIAADADGRIIKVEFYSDSVLLATEHKAPYTFDWKVGKSGNYTLIARATDNWGAVSISDTIHISVVPNQPPGLVITAPSDGQVFAATGTGATIDIKAAAQDVDGRIIQVKFYSDSTLLTTERKEPYTYQWHNVPAGDYTITAVARDNWGAETASAPVTFTVNPPDASLGRIVSSHVKTGREDQTTLQLAPNPAGGLLNIYTTGLQVNQLSTLSLISSAGVIMKTMQVSNPARVMHINVSSFARGTYIVKITSGNKILYRQFVKL